MTDQDARAKRANFALVMREFRDLYAHANSVSGGEWIWHADGSHTDNRWQIEREPETKL